MASVWSLLPHIFQLQVKDDFLVMINDPIKKVTYKITIGELRELLK